MSEPQQPFDQALRGYSKPQVDAYVERIRGLLDELEGRLHKIDEAAKPLTQPSERREDSVFAALGDLVQPGPTALRRADRVRRSAAPARSRSDSGHNSAARASRRDGRPVTAR
jgi:DivIVA domain-containing protein